MRFYQSVGRLRAELLGAFPLTLQSTWEVMARRAMRIEDGSSLSLAGSIETSVMGIGGLSMKARFGSTGIQLLGITIRG